MVALMINLFIIALFQFFNIDVSWFLIVLIVSMTVYRTSIGMRIQLFAYIKMFQIKYDNNLIKELLLLLIVLMYFYYRTGYYLSFNTLITFPFVYVLLFFFLYQGIYSKELINYEDTIFS